MGPANDCNLTVEETIQLGSVTHWIARNPDFEGKKDKLGFDACQMCFLPREIFNGHLFLEGKNLLPYPTVRIKTWFINHEGKYSKLLHI